MRAIACVLAMMASLPALAAPPIGTPAIDGAPIENVLARVKQEVGLFYSDGAKAEQNWTKLLSDLGVKPVCGNGHIAFQITSIKMEFNLVSDQSGGATGGLKIPFSFLGGGSVGPGGAASIDKSGTVDMIYTYKPDSNGPITGDFDGIRKDAVILPALDHLRDALIKETGQKPCFHSLEKTDPDQTLTFTVAVKKDTSQSLGFNFFIVNLGASHESKTAGTNTITVAFRPVAFAGGEQMLMLKQNTTTLAPPPLLRRVQP